MQAENASKTPHAGRRPALRRHIVVVLAIKLVLLIALWQVFVKPHRVKVDAGQAGLRIAESQHHINQGE